jgi:hypothetical protein
MTPLMYAVKDNRAALLDRMVELGTDVCARNNVSTYTARTEHFDIRSTTSRAQTVSQRFVYRLCSECIRCFRSLYSRLQECYLVVIPAILFCFLSKLFSFLKETKRYRISPYYLRKPISGIWRHEVWLKFTDVEEERAAFIFRADLEEGRQYVPSIEWQIYIILQGVHSIF